MRRSTIVLLACLACAAPARAGIDAAGTTSANFLSVGNGASVLAMGGAALGSGGSLNAAAWNPAALGQLAGSQYAISHSTLALSTSQDWLAAGGRWRGGSTRWAVNAIYENDGEFEGRDEFGASTGTFNASNLAFGASAARPFGSAVTIGAGVKWVNQYLGEVSGSGLGFDLGVQARAGAFGFGAAARNVGGNVTFDGESFPMPAVYGFGASWADAVRGLRLNLDANFPSAYYNDVRVGAEWMWQNRVALRTGYRMELGAESGEPLGGPTFGMGAGSNAMWIDYAFLAGQSEAQGAHRLSFSVHPGFMNPGGLAMAPTPIAPRGDAPVTPAREATQPRTLATERGNERPAPAVTPANDVAQPKPMAIVRESAKPVVEAPVAIVQPRIEAPASVSAAPLAARALEPAPRGMRADKPARVPKLELPKEAAVAIVREPATPAAPVPAKSAAVALSAPVLSIRDASAPAAAVAAPVARPEIVAPAEAAATLLAARSVPASTRAMRADKPARVPKLVMPKLEPVAIVREPAQPSAAPLASAPESPAPIVRRDDPPVVRVAASAVPAPAVVPATAPNTEPIARPQPVTPSAPAKRPATIVVAKGQTLLDIAKQWDNSVPALMMENNLVSEQVKPGQKLRLPPAGRK